MTQSDNAAGHDTPDHCENCHVPLHGEFCHQCGQSIHNPIRHAGHAIEEVFESFWHLDGRVFRTLRDLLVPGRTAIEYLAGHRQRYLPPLRLFVVMSLLAFFVGQLTIRMDQRSVQLGTDISAITDSRTVEEVERNRDRLLAEIEEARKEDGQAMPGVDAVLIAAQVQIRGEAANRIVELTPAKEGAAAPGQEGGGGEPQARRRSEGALFSAGNEVWNPVANPVKIDSLPGFANDWVNRRLVNGRDNIERMQGRPDLWFQAFMGSVPSALFLLVPVFALMLKLAYLFKRRLYLEHMVVALYSHVYLLIALTAIFVLMAVSGWVQPHAGWLAVVLNLATLALLLWMPVYLLLMQKRVYAQGWPMTLLKYALIGFVYLQLLVFATAAMFLATLVKA